MSNKHACHIVACNKNAYYTIVCNKNACHTVVCNKNVCLTVVSLYIMWGIVNFPIHTYKTKMYCVTYK